MVLPLSLLQATKEQALLVELKDGTTYNGILMNCDSFMNINLSEAVCTSRTGTQFWKIPEVYIRGSQIKYFRVPEEVLEVVKEGDKMANRAAAAAGRSRGGGSGFARGTARGGFRGAGAATRGGPRPPFPGNNAGPSSSGPMRGGMGATRGRGGRGGPSVAASRGSSRGGGGGGGSGSS